MPRDRAHYVRETNKRSGGAEMISQGYANYDKFVTVAAINFASVLDDKAATLDKMEANIREAVAQEVDLIAFPEEALIAEEFRKLAHRA